MLNILDLNGDELILFSYILSKQIVENYSCEEVAVISEFFVNIHSQLAIFVAKAVLNKMESDSCNTKTEKIK